jgi:hypothetical protein
LLQDVQVQGPFEFSPDGQRLLFASPRNGNFDIYVATLDTAGKEALKKLSSQTDLSPALAAAGHPTGLSTSGQSGSAAVSNPGAPAAVQPVAAAPSMSGGENGILPTSISPYVLALAGLAALWAAVEGILIARQRRKRRSSGSHG